MVQEEERGVEREWQEDVCQISLDLQMQKEDCQGAEAERKAEEAERRVEEAEEEKEVEEEEEEEAAPECSITHNRKLTNKQR